MTGCREDDLLRLTLIISSLGVGGAQRVLTTLANAWAGQGWQVTVLTLDDGSMPPFFPLAPSIHHQALGLYKVSGNWWRRITNNLSRLRILRHSVRDSAPQVVLSYSDRTNVLVLCALLLTSYPVVVAEHTAVGVASIGRIWSGLRRLLYPRAAVVVVLTERALLAFPESMRPRIRVIPNPVVAGGGPSHREAKEGRKICIALGSLRPEKGFDLLLRAFAVTAGRHPEWDLLILGEGGLRPELEDLGRKLGLAGRFTLAGNVTEPEGYLNRADLFVLPSRLEGFPMALCEAMACGLPVIAADCATGPREIIRPGIDGLLVPPEDVAALERALDALMDDPDRRQRLGRRAAELPQRFSLEEVAGRYEKLLNEVIAAQ